MPTPTKGPRLGGGPAHERLMLGNLAQSLFEHDQITTTQAKAKRLRPLAERLITFAKRGDLHARRKVMTVVKDKGVVHRLFTEIAPDMAEREAQAVEVAVLIARKVAGEALEASQHGAMDARTLVQRRAVLELIAQQPRVVNLGVGMPAAVGALAEQEGARGFTLTVEAGPIGGTPADGLSFGASAYRCRTARTGSE